MATPAPKIKLLRTKTKSSITDFSFINGRSINLMVISRIIQYYSIISNGHHGNAQFVKIEMKPTI